ncbi:MAG: hypothetical protein ACRCU6_04270 [Fusobacteriaceae bacterium]
MENQLEEIIRIMTEQKAEIDILRNELSEVKAQQKPEPIKELDSFDKAWQYYNINGGRK